MSMPVISALDFTGENMVDERIPLDTPIRNFYRNKTIFLSGGTGFLGQLYIEKLLRCRVKLIYVLARSKKNKTSAERIKEAFNGVVFSKVKSMDPNYMNRIYVIEGDTEKADLGISSDQRKEIIDNVEIVLHAAADVRFDKSLQELCFTNVRGTNALIELVKEMKNIILFAYVSTAYSQYYQQSLEEKFYEPPLDPDQMIRIAEHFSRSGTDELDWVTDKLIEPWANTYVFTKSLSEELVRRLANEIPTVVIRPSIIISTYEDPIPAWCNNVYGLNGVIVGSGLGFIRIILSFEDTSTNLICADFVTNGTLAAMWEKATEKTGLTKLNDIDEQKIIYHITSGDTTTNGDLFKRLSKLFSKYPACSSIWIPSITFCSNMISFFIFSILYHFIPGIFYDLFLMLTNNKIRLMPMYRKSQDFLVRLAYFSNKNWLFDNNNMKKLVEKMSKRR